MVYLCRDTSNSKILFKIWSRRFGGSRSGDFEQFKTGQRFAT